jgi:hypothetical protein
MSIQHTTSDHNSHHNPFYQRALLAGELFERWQDSTVEERLELILTHGQGVAEWTHPSVLQVIAAYLDKPDVWLRIITTCKTRGITPRHLEQACVRLKEAQREVLRKQWAARQN